MPQTTTIRPFWSAPEAATAGYPVFPIKEKAPAVEGGFYAATTDHSQIAAWIEEGRERHDVAFATGLPSGVVVVEADTAEGYEWMEQRYGPPQAATKRGGHWYFKHPKNGKISSRTLSEIMPGLDRKGDGGYVIMPPSRNKAWTNGIPDISSLSALPQELRDRKACRNGAEAPKLNDALHEKAAGAIARRVSEISQGERHEHLKHTCGVLLSRDVSPGDAEIILKAAWDKVGGELAERAPQEVPNTLRTTEEALTAGRATGVPSMERITPGLYDELSKIFGWSAPIKPNGRVAGAGEDFGRFNLTDMGNAERFVARHGRTVRYCYPWSKWLVWTGTRWECDNAGRVHKLAKETVRSIYQEAAAAEDEGRRKAIAGHATRSEAEARVKAMLELAKSEVPVSPDELDADPWLLNALNGTVDLRTGELWPHRREDLLTKMAGAEYLPDAVAPTWQTFFERVQPSEALRGFVWRAVGYSATGDTSEQVILINHGPGANGKSTAQEAVAEALGDYAMKAPSEMLLAKRAGAIPNDVARLKGARFVAASETEDGRRFAESLVKELTGQDTITARFMRAEWFDFKPTHKLWLSTNHKPEIRGTDNAIWRRIRLIPWSVVIPPIKQDRKLPEKLRAELSGILCWVVQGCLEWQRKGLQAPDEVRRATGEYRAEMDVLGQFIKECCEKGPDKSETAAALYKAYEIWCEDGGEHAVSKRKFGTQLRERGFERYRGGKDGAHRWRRVSLLTYWKTRICRGSDPTDTKLPMNGSKETREEVNDTLGSVGSERSVTKEEEQQICRLVEEGMSEAWARKQVRGEGSSDV